MSVWKRCLEDALTAGSVQREGAGPVRDLLITFVKNTHLSLERGRRRREEEEGEGEGRRERERGGRKEGGGIERDK